MSIKSQLYAEFQRTFVPGKEPIDLTPAHHKIYRNFSLMTGEKLRRTQYANQPFAVTREIRDYKKTCFQSGSVSQRIKSKLRNIFSRSKPGEELEFRMTVGGVIH